MKKQLVRNNLTQVAKYETDLKPENESTFSQNKEEKLHEGQSREWNIGTFCF